MPNKTRNILVSVGAQGKISLLDDIRLLQKLGYNIFATGTLC
jgi:hypothetical protein